MKLNASILVKLLFWVIVLHIILIAVTILEVAFYSFVINPGQINAIYEAHAQQSGPIVSTILGFIGVYVIASRWANKNPANKKIICWGIPVVYIITDVIMLIVFRTPIMPNLLAFGISYFTKILAGGLALRK